jgi:hypothetical protein
MAISKAIGAMNEINPGKANAVSLKNSPVVWPCEAMNSSWRKATASHTTTVNEPRIIATAARACRKM